jgi:hypothetical protein
VPSSAGASRGPIGDNEAGASLLPASAIAKINNPGEEEKGRASASDLLVIQEVHRDSPPVGGAMIESPKIFYDSLFFLHLVSLGIYFDKTYLNFQN